METVVSAILIGMLAWSFFYVLFKDKKERDKLQEKKSTDNDSKDYKTDKDSNDSKDSKIDSDSKEDNLISYSPIRWAKYTKIIMLSEEEPLNLYNRNQCTEEEAEALAFANLICLVHQYKLDEKGFASILYFLNKTNIAYKSVYKSERILETEKVFIAKKLARTYYAKEFIEDKNCNKDFTNTEAYVLLKKVSLLGLIATLFIIWIIFWNGDHSVFDPKYSLFKDFLTDGLDMYYIKAKSMANFFAFAVIPLAWILRDVMGMFLLSTYAVISKKL